MDEDLRKVKLLKVSGKERKRERETKTDSNQNANDKNESFVIIINNEDMTFTGFALSGEN